MSGRDEPDWGDVLKGLLGVAAGLMTIRQALKTCPCDGSPMPFRARCDHCGHLHVL